MPAYLDVVGRSDRAFEVAGEALVALTKAAPFDDVRAMMDQLDAAYRREGGGGLLA